VSTVDAEGFIDNMKSRLGMMASNSVISGDELLEVRSLIEVPSARLAASRRTEDDLTAMRLAAEGNFTSDTRDLRGHHSRDFHLLVVRAAHNVLLTSIARPIFAVWAQTGLGTSTEWADIDDEHFEIVELIEKGDGDGAARVTEKHLRNLRAATATDLETESHQVELLRQRRANARQ
jgi:GntR family transcriptional repressor for pyruvate dehydrogenase complex